VAVVQQAYVCGVSTRRVDQLVESLGLRISRSEVSRICAGLDEQVEAFRSRPLEGRYPYLWLDAKVEKVRDGGQLVVSDAHEGLKNAIAQVIGRPWQRCTVHFLREALGHARREQQPMLAALIRPIFNADSGEQARELLGQALERLQRPLPKVAALLNRRGGPARLLRLPRRPLAQAAEHEPARDRRRCQRRGFACGLRKPFAES